jgi:energy-coupling factor transport system permease protein
MRNRMIFGRFIPTGSWVHDLDPRAKTLSMLLFMVAVFMIDNYIGVLIGLVFSLMIMRSTKIPLLYYARTIKPLLFILLFIVIFHLLFDTTDGQIVDAGMLKFYAGGLEKGLISASRMILFVSFAAILTFTAETYSLHGIISR